jgi:hypothetical protein
MQEENIFEGDPQPWWDPFIPEFPLTDEEIETKIRLLEEHSGPPAAVNSTRAISILIIGLFAGILHFGSKEIRKHQRQNGEQQQVKEQK